MNYQYFFPEICPQSVALFHIFREVRQMHVTLAGQRVVHGEGGGETVVRMTAGTELQVVPQQLLVVGVGTVLDDGLCTLHRALATQVGHTLLRHDDIHVVLRRILVGHEGYHTGDAAALGHRRTCKYR